MATIVKPLFAFAILTVLSVANPGVGASVLAQASGLRTGLDMIDMVSPPVLCMEDRNPTVPDKCGGPTGGGTR
jgi:hypothetical protein